MVFTFDSTQLGAPVLSGLQGALRGVIKACAIDGFGAGAVATLTVSGGVATATYSGSHPFKVGYVAQYAGATPAALNGNKVILSITANAVTFAAPGVPDGAATGSITSKAAPAGWQELFAGTLANVIALKPAAVEATGCVLRIDDTTTSTARMVGYESMSDINTGAGPFPTTAQVSGGLYLPKSELTTSAARPWRMYVTSRAIILAIAPNSAQPTSYGVYVLGDFPSNKGVDPYACIVSGGGTGVTNGTGSTVWDGSAAVSFPASTNFGCYAARGALGIGGSVGVMKLGPLAGVTRVFSGAVTYPLATLTFPNPSDNSLRLGPVDLYIGGDLRGVLPGVYHSPQPVAMGGYFGVGQRVAGQGVYEGRVFEAISVGDPGGPSTGVLFVDVTGPWGV
ncbi:hypothetical protein CLU88_4352 [Acidovorax sp. 56]|uniref:hypothetical protein n=1 Tax=Acidovorax sp. 56 TaxID=2035205 RepID=UPI000C56CB37|nr:hypothetical protein [Acidovorax sp. 56]PIF29423.1 hypothetical protein CLU88_4352 [Acidovorax sp. 56]